MRIVILAAFSDELCSIAKNFLDLKETVISKCRCLRGQWEEHELIISLTGIGTSAAAITSILLCEVLQPDLIIFCGVAGGLQLGQNIGDLILATKIIDADLYQLPVILQGTPYQHALIDPHQLTAIDYEYVLHPSLCELVAACSLDGLATGTIVTSNIFPAPKNLFQEIKNLHCSAIEMESSAVFKAASYYDIPVLCLRALSNLLDEFGNDLGTTPDALVICAERLSIGLMTLLKQLAPVAAVAQFKQQEKIKKLIAYYNLIQHPEGGWYRRTFQSIDWVQAQGAALVRYQGELRAAGTSIMYLLQQGDFSAWHTVQSDETWFFLDGEPLLLRVIDSCGMLQEIVLGQGILQYTVRAGDLFAAEPLGRFCITGCMVTPGFDFKDFKLCSRAEFLITYPQHSALVRLARDQSVLDGDKH